MRKKTLHIPSLVLPAVPVMLMAPSALLLALPAWLGVLLTALSACLPLLWRLHKATQALRAQADEHSEFTREMLDVIPHPIFVKDENSQYLIVNKAFCEEHCLTLDQVIGRTTAQVANDPEVSNAWRAEDLSVLAGQSIRVEKHEKHPVHGGERHRLIIKSACHTHNGAAFIVGINFDISPWWITEQDLQQELHQERDQYQQTYAFLQRVMDLIPHPVYVKDAAGYCIIANRATVLENALSTQQTTGEAAQGHTSAEAAVEDLAVLAGGTVLREARAIDMQTGQERAYIISKGCCLDANGDAVIVAVQVDLTEQRLAERNLQQTLANEVALRERTHLFIQSLIDNIPDPVFIKKAGGRYEMINEAFAQYRMVDKLTWKGFNLNAPPQSAGQRETTMSEDDQVLAGLEIEKEDHTVRKQTGEEVFRIISKRRSVFFDGDPVVVGVERHISKWRIAERELNDVLQREMEQRLRTERFVQDLIDVIPDPVYVKNGEGAYLIVNEAFARYRHRPRAELIGFKSSELTLNADSASASETEDQRVIAGEVIFKEQHSTMPVTGKECFRLVSKRRCVGVDGIPVVVGIDHYITEMRLAERELKRLAEEDALTGIANRRHFNAEARRAIEQGHRHGEVLSVLMLDLDHFKRINDQYGHNVGDEVLREMSKRMRESFRKSDLPGRWGGEEFIALLPHTAIETAYQVAERLRSQLADTPVETSGGNISVTLSGGIAQRRDGDTLESLIGRADTALYSAKNAGRNRVHFTAEPQPPASTTFAAETPEA